MRISKSVSFPVKLDSWPGSRLRIGLIALATDHSSECELWEMMPAGAAELFVTRVLNQNPTTVENLRAMAPRLTAAAELLLPGSPLDAIIYSCTSGTAVIGVDEISRRVQAAKSGCPVTTPLSAAAAAIETLGIKRLAVLTPYVEEVNRRIGDALLATGVDITSFLSFGLESDVDMALIPAPQLLAAALEADSPDADALFVSCTALRTVGLVRELEQRLAKPVITSNQAMFWHALKLAGHRRNLSGYGTLLETLES